MLAPLSWLKDYITIKSDPKKLGLRLTEIGLGTEKITKEKNDVLFEFEITPNRPDLLSIIGITREIAAIENEKVRLPKTNLDITSFKPKKTLPLKIKTDSKINPRFTALIIDNVTVKESPKWLKEKLEKIGQRSINNIVDITNFVMYELGNPIHTFYYEKINGHVMHVDTAKAGEIFKSVDGISYQLPENAVIIRDREKIIDLCGIKGGFNSGTFPDTRTIVLRVPVEIPILIRRTSQALRLRSDASSIFERGVNAGGTIDALLRCASLILEIAGGEIASKLYDIKTENFTTWKLSLRLNRLNKILGIEVPQKKVLEILDSLNLSPKLAVNDSITCLIPTYRNDLKIEEDLIEEIARIYGLNNFPKTLPVGQIPTIQIPYHKDYRIDEKVKTLLQSAGFSEIYTYSLISENDLNKIAINSGSVLKIDTPVSREYEYLRPTLKINLLKALQKNKANFDKLNLFELGKVYLGRTVTDAKEEYRLSGITNTKNFFEVKGILGRLYNDLNIPTDPTEFIEVLEDGIFFELNYDHLLKNALTKKTYAPISNFPPIVEDLAIIAPKNILTGTLIDTIKKQNRLITSVSLLDKFDNTRTFHIIYQSYEKNLTNEEIEPIRAKILKTLSEKFTAKLKT